MPGIIFFAIMVIAYPDEEDATQKNLQEAQMCCRYWIDESPEFREIVDEMFSWEKYDMDKVTVSGEVRPADIVPVLAPDSAGRRAVFPMKWGFGGRSLLVNARTETAALKPAFCEAWKRHRCIVPASWYFEWEHPPGADGKKRTGDKYRIRPRNAAMTWLCGLYRIENGRPVFVVLTREPGEEIRFIHDRMPLILPEELTDEWIRPDAKPEELIREALTKMSFEKAAG